MFGYGALSEAPFASQPGNVVNVRIFLEGVSGTSAVNGVFVSGDNNVDVSGLAAVGQLNDVTVNVGTGIDVPVSGLFALTAVGNVTVTGGTGITVNLVGVESPTIVGRVNVWGRIVPNPGTVYTEIQPDPNTIWIEVAA